MARSTSQRFTGSCRLKLVAASIALAAAAPAVNAKEDELTALKRALEEARAEIAAQAARLAAQQQMLDEQRRRLDAIAQALARASTERAPAEVAEAQRPATRVGVEAAPAAPAVQPQTVTAQPLLLTPRGTWVVEPSLQYSYVSNNRISIVGFTVLPAITVGLIDVQQASRNTLTGALALRYGLVTGVEVEARVPYVQRDDTFVTRPLNAPGTSDVTTSVSGQGIGDIEAAVRYQLPWTSRSGLGLITALQVKSRTGTGPLELPLNPVTDQPTELATGTGFWSIQPGLTAVLPNDPAVLYGGLSYQWNIARDYGGNIGRYDPGDGVDFNAGLGLALNEVSSLSVGYDHLWLGSNRQNGAPIPGSLSLQVGRLLVGYSHRLGRTSYLQFSLAAGLTDAAPDVQLTARFPLSY